MTLSGIVTVAIVAALIAAVVGPTLTWTFQVVRAVFHPAYNTPLRRVLRRAR